MSSSLIRVAIFSQASLRAADKSLFLSLHASVAQLVEQGTENPRVVGSIPTGGTINADLAHLVERNLAKVEVAGSSPVIRSKSNILKRMLLLSKKENLHILLLRRRSQAVRQKSAKLLFPGPIPGGASKTKSTS